MTAAAETRASPPSQVGVAAGLRARAWDVAVWVTMAVWTTVLFVVARDAYTSYRVGRFDLGNMVQAVWSTAHGRPLEYTHGAGEQMARLGAHVDPFLALLAPLWLLWPSPLVLAFAQIAVVACGALPVFWLARRHTGCERAAGLLALAYLAYPWVATSATAAIHPVTFAITFLLFCVWYLDTDRLVPFAVFAALTMSTGELMGLPILALGVWYALARKRRAAGAAIACAGVAWTAIAVFVLVPAFAGEDSMYYGFYDEVGGSPQGVVRMLFTDPTTVLSALVEGHDVAYLLWLAVPLLGLFVLSPGLALVALPQLLANGLSDFRSMTDPRYHSVAAVIPFLLAATVLGVARLAPGRRLAAIAGVLVCSTLVSIAVGPWARAAGLAPLGGRASVASRRIGALDAAVALVPADAAVSASNTAGARLSSRRYVYSVPVLGRAEWVVVDRSDPWVVRDDSPILTRDPRGVAAFVAELHRAAEWREVSSRDGVIVFHHVGRRAATRGRAR